MDTVNTQSGRGIPISDVGTPATATVGTGTNQQSQTMYAPTGQNNTTTPPVITPESLQPVPSIQLPSAPTPSTTGVSSNTGIPNPTIPTAESIIANANTNTPAQTQQTGILSRIAALIGGNQTQTTLTNNAETSAGVPALTTTLNGLNTQLQGLNDQSTALQNAAAYTIPNQEQQNATGRGITAAGLAPISAADLRANQIKQGAIATQALTLKSAIYGAQGQLSIAKDAADKAATAQYEQEQQQIDYQKAQLDALTPTLNKEEKAQAAVVQAQLADRQTQINNAMDDKKSIIALVTATLINNPNDPAAHYAAQQALAESNKQVPDLSAALKLVGQYQKDPVATQKAVLDNQLLKSQITKAQYDAQISANTLKMSSGGTTVPITDQNSGKSINVPVSIAPYTNISHSGVGYMDASTLEGTPTQKTSLINQAQASGLKVITNKNTATDLFNVGDANNKLDTILTTLSNIDQPSALSRDLGGLGLTAFAQMAQTDPQKAAAGVLSSIGTDILKAMQGVQGSRMSQAAVANINKELPTIYDTQATAAAKVTNLKALLSDREDAILGVKGPNSANNTGTMTVMTGPDGNQYNVPNNQVDAFIKAGGKK